MGGSERSRPRTLLIGRAANIQRLKDSVHILEDVCSEMTQRALCVCAVCVRRVHAPCACVQYVHAHQVSVTNST